MTTPELPAHVSEILDGDYDLEQCFEIMRAARVKAEHVFKETVSDAEIDGVVSGIFAPLNDLSNEVEVTLRRLHLRITETQDASA
ncbi:hypothetical protein AADG42_09385 [Ammonicoccus fulvus]|uniref:Uncharacterized protein n=1 Tax=Ammonicoccus fulvus TaxID=3138240 RepID=A0ABZ3FN79_9ACTN